MKVKISNPVARTERIIDSVSRVVYDCNHPFELAVWHAGEIDMLPLDCQNHLIDIMSFSPMRVVQFNDNHLWKVDLCNRVTKAHYSVKFPNQLCIHQGGEIDFRTLGASDSFEVKEVNPV